MAVAAPAWPLRIYYDAACPLCARELHALRDHDRDGRLDLRDCSPPGFRDADLEAAGLSPELLMRRIHARDANGRWLVGIDVFEVAYRAVGVDAVAALWGNRRLRPLWDRLYPWIADHRMQLSRLGFDRPFEWIVRALARRAARRADPAACEDGRCRIESDRGG
jgi:predicted DCC family thiol-disulfide oxidoreductase YuxK